MSKTAIIDLDSVAFAIGNPNKILDEQGNPVKVKSAAGNMVFSTVEKTIDELRQSADIIMTDILNACNAESYIGFIKGSNTTAFRLQVNPEYKGNRKKESPWWWGIVKQHLLTKWKAVEANGLEVDDAVNITRLMDSTSFIVAIDGDLLGLEGTHYNWKKREWITVNFEQSEYKFWKDMIVGQPGDNIKGIPSKGEAYWKNYYKDTLLGQLRSQVFEDYLNNLGEYYGIKEFYKNYMSLRILEPGNIDFTIPEPIQWKNQETVEELFK